MEGRSSRLPASVLPTGELNNLQKNTKKTNTEKTNTQKTNTKKKNTKRQIQKKTNAKKDKHKKDRRKKTYKTYLGLIRVPGGEGRGSGKRKKFQIFQLKEQQHQKVNRGANQPIIRHVFKDLNLMIISKG